MEHRRTGWDVQRQVKDFFDFYFSDDYTSAEHHEYKKIFKSEVRIKKIDFLIRNPDYLSYELLLIAADDHSKKQEIKQTVKTKYDTSDQNRPILAKIY